MSNKNMAILKPKSIEPLPGKNPSTTGPKQMTPAQQKMGQPTKK